MPYPAMTETEVHRRVARRNALHWTFGLLLIPTAAGLWYASFWVLWWLTAIAVYPWVERVGNIPSYVAWVGTFLLAVEGLRRTRPLFDLEDFRRSFFGDNPLTDTPAGAALHWYAGSPLGVSYFLAQALFLAPQATIHVVLLLRNRLRCEPHTIAEAAAIHRRLETARKWHQVSDFPGQAAALCLLDRLGLIRTRTEKGHREIKLRLADPA